MVTVSAMATTLFLGGGTIPWLPSLWAGFDSGWFQFLAFLIKTLAFLFLFIWLRGTLPRLRYDQFMRLGWKVLVPGSLLWILTIFAIRTYRSSDGSIAALLVTIGIALAVVLVIAFLIPDRPVEQEPVVELASDYPVPPLDLVVPARSKHKLRAAEAKDTTAVTAGAPAKETDDV